MGLLALNMFHTINYDCLLVSSKHVPRKRLGINVVLPHVIRFLMGISITHVHDMKTPYLIDLLAIPVVTSHLGSSSSVTRASENGLAELLGLGDATMVGRLAFLSPGFTYMYRRLIGVLVCISVLRGLVAARGGAVVRARGRGLVGMTR